MSQGRGETLDNVDNLTAESRNLDMLRALAVACVFVAHLTLSLISRPYPQWPDKWIAPLYEMGRIGVQIFFVHTSLVLLLSLQRQKPPNLFLNFYVRRLFRIYPLSLTCIIITLLFRIPYLPRDAFFPPEWTAVLSDLLLIQNLTHTKEFIFPLWTLPLEVQMYAALPVIYVLLSRFGSAPFVLMMWAATFAAARVWPFFFFVPYFMGGVFGYQVSREKTFRAPGIFWPMALVLVLFVQGWVRHNIAAELHSDYVMCMVVGGMAANFRDLRPSWLTAACHTIAKYSYGIYLFHIPVIWLVFFKLMFLPLAIRWVLLCVLMVLVPWLAYHLVEAPMIGIGRRLASRVRLPGVSLDERLQAAATTDRPEDVLSGMQSIRRTEP